MIELRDLSAGFSGKAVLHGVSMTLQPGNVTVLLGPNGCGKSTLLRTILSLQPKLGGQVLVDGVPSDSLTPRQLAQKAAYLPQSRAVPNITARRMVLHGRFPYLSYPRRYRPEDYAAAQQAMEMADAADLADCPMQSLSGGQRQKIYLAMALAQQTQTILMDEPTTYLDIRHQLDVMSMAKRLAAEGKAVVLVLHDLCQALRCADCTALFGQGQLLFLGTPADAFLSGQLDRAFGITLRRVQTPSGWQYYCK